MSRSTVPSYCLHKASGRAVVKHKGTVHYIGKHGTRASKAEYARLIAQWSAGDSEHPAAAREDITIVELLAAFHRYAAKHYRKDGRPTQEVTNIKVALRPLKALYATSLVRDFGPLKLKAIQSLLIKGYTDADGAHVAGLARHTVNARIGVIKRVFRWAVSEEMAPPSLAHALDTVRGLQRGRTDARETAPVLPVDDAVVKVTLPHLPPVVADMVRFQRLTGCRPHEVCILRPCDVDRTGEVWLYRPASHKTEHHGRDRVILVGPKAQEILAPYLLSARGAHCFSPTDSERKRKARLRANRKTPVQPSQVDRSKRRPKLQPTDTYTKDSFNRAIRRACDRADKLARKDDPGVAANKRIVPHWTPNQLRHTAATEIRRQFGLEAAQVCLGHSAANVTQLYAERDVRLGLEVMKKIG
jgi:integrase